MIATNKIRTYQAAGKLMLFGEYLVMKGANSIAFPLKYGQKLTVSKADELLWESYSPEGLWFFMKTDNELCIIDTNSIEVAEKLILLLQLIQKENPSISFQSYFKMEANFNLNWGLGSSSTLISLLSQWSGVDAKKLLQASFGGSGYDVACATAKRPILYCNGRVEKEVVIPSSISDCFLFVYSGKKQSSREEISRFQKSKVTSDHIRVINGIIDQAMQTDDIILFEKQLNASENIISEILGVQRLKERLFPDYPYAIKSLGAWGGDFFLATYRELKIAREYFTKKGYKTQFTYKELIK